MASRTTRPTQPREMLRTDGIRHAVEVGSSPSFVAPAIGADTPMPLQWSSLGQAVQSGSTDPATELTSDLRRAFLEQLFENSLDALVIVDPTFRALCANHEFQRMFGFSPAEVLSSNVETLILPPDRTAEAQWITQCLHHQEQITLETKRRHRDGTLIDVSLTVAPLLVSGRAQAFYFLYRNITDRKHTQALSSALYRIAEKSVLDNDVQQFFASVHGIIDEIIPAKNFSIALRDPESQLLSFPYFVDEREFPPAASKVGRGLVEYVLRTGRPLLCTPERYRQLLQSGEIDAGCPPPQWLGVPLQINNHCFGALVIKNYSEKLPLHERDVEVLTLISRQVSAILDNKRTEQSLRRSEVRYRSLVQTAVYGMYRSNLDGQFLDVNPALIGMLGYDSAMDVLALDPEKSVFFDPGEYSSLFSEFRRTGRVDGFEARWKRKDGAIIVVRISGRAVAREVAAEDQPSDVLEAIAEDITERRMLEDQFRQSQKMEAVGRLAGGIAHDFNNLLMVVSGYTEILLEQLPAGHPLQSKAEAIRQASERASALTRQLLAFSRKQHLELRVVEPNSVVQEMERLLRPLIGSDVELSTNLDPAAGCIRADAGQLGQVIMNLVVNSKDAMPAGGRICIRTEHVLLDDFYRPENTFIKRGPYVMISVSDDGHGMDRDTQAHAFEPFFTTKEKGKGTGLGLSTVYGIVKQCGGYVFVQSELGRGTVFTVYLPRIEETESAPIAGSTTATSVATQGSETVLLVEDEDSVRQLVFDTLVARGYQVLQAANGQSALDLAARHAGRIDLIVTDLVMPGLGGHELIQQLLPSRPESKVLYLSGYAEDAVNLDSVPGAAAAFLQKPFTLQSLARKVREVLGRQSSAAAAGSSSSLA